MSGITLYYFDFWGRGELSRLLLALSGQPWQDVRFTRHEWDTADKWKALSPFGQAPFMKYEDKIYGQSVAIAGFIARQFGLAGKTNLESLRNDEVVCLVQDLMKLLVDIYYEQDPAKKEQLVDKLKNVDVPNFYSFFERMLTENGGTGFFVGHQVSMADLAVYDIVTNTQAWFQTEFQAGYGGLEALIRNVEGNANVGKYLDEQKQNKK